MRPSRGERSPGDWGFRRPNARDAQAGTTATGGGRVKSAKVESALGRTAGGSDSSTVTTEAAGAGAGVCTRCTVTWAAAQSEQLAWVSAPSAWVWATCTAPATTTSRTQTSARRTLHEDAARDMRQTRPISGHYTAEHGVCAQAGGDGWHMQTRKEAPRTLRREALVLTGPLRCAG
jgi:hypothetical protein